MTWLAGILALLLSLDPVGSYLTRLYPEHINVASPIPQSPGAFGYVEWDTRQVWVDPEAIYRWGPYLTQHDLDAIAACALVHESAHLRFPRREHEIAMIYGYMCLDRLGASAQVKDHVYRQIEATVVVKPRDDHE